MRKKVPWLALSLVSAALLFLISCAPSATTTKPSATTTAAPTTAVKTTPAATTAAPSGKPQYGGTITLLQATNITIFGTAVSNRPSGTPFMWEQITTSDRTVSLANGGKMAGEGAVRWMFDRKGVIIAPAEGKTKEELELLAIELGAEDIFLHGNALDIYTKPEDLEKMKKALEEKQIKIDSASLDYVAKEEVELSEKEKEAAQRLFEALDENDAVNDIYSNIKN